MKKFIAILAGLSFSTCIFAAETPLCILPNVKMDSSPETPDPGCMIIINNAKKLAESLKFSVDWINSTALPAQLSVGAVYLQPITMAPAGMMRPRNQSDIHLELDIHAKQNFKARGFAPGDWLPNAEITYHIQKIGEFKIINGELMTMVASDGAHYGDNVKLSGPGFYLVTFEAHNNPHFGWHVDTDSKILGTEYVNWNFKQTYLMKWAGVGKLGGY